jgi:hypothetical protein
MRIWHRTITILLALGVASSAGAGNLTKRAVLEPDKARTAGARWLIQHQGDDGGWGAGSWDRAAGGPASDVATTSLAVMALLRDANGEPVHRQAVQRGVLFVVHAIEASSSDGARLQGPSGTQPQHKLGQNVDTHFAALMLGEVSKNVKLEEHTRVDSAYDKVLTKVVAAQQADGSFDGNGWAPVLSSSVAAQSLYRARDLGKSVASEILEKSDDYQRKLVDAETGIFDASAGAGVDLYAAASSLANNVDAAKRPEARAPALAEAAAKASADAIRRDTDRIIAGFGSVGGEEMLSYMMISDTMAEQGGEDWNAWELKMGTHLVASQNTDGSWSGHHCITSTTFVTAAAVMTLGSGDAIEARAANEGSANTQSIANRR